MVTASTINAPAAPVGSVAVDALAAVDLLAVAVRSKDGGEERAGQEAMCAAVTSAMTSGVHLLVEAPTGTGKSLAYLVPAIRAAVVSRAPLDDSTAGPSSAPSADSATAAAARARQGRTVVATATKALQEQLVREDLPFLTSALAASGAKFSFAMLKGRSNYWCRARAAELAVAPPPPPSLFSSSASAFTGEQFARLSDWAKTSLTGDLGDYDEAIPPQLESSVTISAGECPGAAKCAFGDTCFAEAARARAAKANIVVVNTALYATHLASDGAVLPDHATVVIDEAHALEDIVCSIFAVEITANRVRRLASRLRATMSPGDVGIRLRDAANVLEVVLEGLDDKRIDAWDGPIGAAVAVIGSLAATARVVCEEAASAARAAGDVIAATHSAQTVRMAASLGDDADRICDASAYASHVAWVETSASHAALHFAPVEAAPILAARLFPSVTVIATSATLALGGSFDDIARRFGLTWNAPGGDVPPMWNALAVATPFDHARQGFLYCPTHLPEPKHPGFGAALHVELATLATAAGGRTLALFTSRAAMTAAAAALRASTDLSVLVQGELPRAELLTRFKAGPRTVLVATQSFWVGVDVAGAALNLVTIDKIPFPRPNDPVFEARRDAVTARRGNSFGEVDLPRAATLLAQGTGRLIRSTGDFGVVCVFDRRLATARYKSFLLGSLPPFQRVTNGARVVTALRWLDERANEAPGTV